MSMINDGLFGLAVGNAMGVSTKNIKREVLLANPVTSMVGNNAFSVDPGTWSYDTSVVLATMDSIIKCDGINYNDVMSKYCDWIGKSNYTTSSLVFDNNNTIKSALVNFLKNKKEAINSGLSDALDNGSLMRCFPVALYCYYNKLKDYEVYNLVKEISSITHSNEVVILGCFIYVNYLLFILNGKDKFASYNMIKCIDYYSYFDEDIIEYYNRLLKTNISNLRVDDLKSDDYVVHTIESSIWVLLNTNSYAEAIVGSINLGGATDTIGAFVGSIAGVLYGFESIPDKWLSVLKNSDYIDQISFNFENTF